VRSDQKTTPSGAKYWREFIAFLLPDLGALSFQYWSFHRDGFWRRKAMTDCRLHRLVRERDLPTYAGLRRTQIAELIKRGEFPRPIRLSDGGRAKAWVEAELIIWQRQRLAKRDID
jgi:predicted DNA-binding transcriptional regulator AlpA